jgi:hypothetical protein
VSDALVEHLDTYAHHELVTSSLASVEVARALSAVGAAELAARAVRRSDRIEVGDVAVPDLAMVAPFWTSRGPFRRLCCGPWMRSR